MDHRLAHGNTPLERAGPVAFTARGDLWVYPVRAAAERMHDLIRFTPGIASGFCLATWHNATRPRAGGTIWRAN